MGRDEDVQGRGTDRAGGGPRTGAVRAALRLVLGRPPRGFVDGADAGADGRGPARLGRGGRFLPDYAPYDGERPVA